jgi:hypothetical protein
MRKHATVIALLAALAPPVAAPAQDGILAWTGGIGTEEREAAPKDGTKLVFFVESGSFLADVQVTVKDANGRELLNAVSKGPWMILNLEPGRYRVLATHDGQQQGGTIEVTGNNQEFAYMFKAQ